MADEIESKVKELIVQNEDARPISTVRKDYVASIVEFLKLSAEKERSSSLTDRSTNVYVNLSSTELERKLSDAVAWLRTNEGKERLDISDGGNPQVSEVVEGSQRVIGVSEDNQTGSLDTASPFTSEDHRDNHLMGDTGNN